MQHLDLGTYIHKCLPNSDTIDLSVLEKVYKRSGTCQLEAKLGYFGTLNQADGLHMLGYNEHTKKPEIIPE